MKIREIIARSLNPFFIIRMSACFPSWMDSTHNLLKNNVPLILISNVSKIKNVIVSNTNQISNIVYASTYVMSSGRKYVNNFLPDILIYDSNKITVI